MSLNQMTRTSVVHNSLHNYSVQTPRSLNNSCVCLPKTSSCDAGERKTSSHAAAAAVRMNNLLTENRCCTQTARKCLSKQASLFPTERADTGAQVLCTWHSITSPNSKRITTHCEQFTANIKNDCDNNNSNNIITLFIAPWASVAMSTVKIYLKILLQSLSHLFPRNRSNCSAFFFSSALYKMFLPDLESAHFFK